MTEQKNGYLSPARRLNALNQDDAFFERNTFDAQRAKELFMDILVQTNFADEHLEGLVALSRALRGTHPHMVMTVKRLPAGVTPRPLMEIKKGKLTMQIADQVDMQVGHGIKQDAAIQEVMDEFRVSRREIFRILKVARARRLRMRAQEAEFADWDNWYDDYSIDDQGRLVPAPEKS